MDLDPRTCYRALETRDGRFDGRFFTGVTTTGVYCRPVCPARTPHAEHCRFFACAAAAQAAGFRPCLRCRPEAAPGTPAWHGTESTVSRALRLIASGALDGESGIDALAARLGVGDRHLRRLFLRHLGAPPVAIAQTHRAHFAKKLLDETCLPVRDVAGAAGFASVRRFNATMRATWGRSPRELRSRATATAPPGLALRLAFRPPFDWDAMLAWLAPRALPAVETVRDGKYRRTMRVGGAPGTVTVHRPAGASHLVARLQLAGTPPLLQIAARLRHLFDLDADPAAITAHLRADCRLAFLLRARPGLRIPGAWDGFEMAVRAVLGQQVSVQAARTLAGRLVESHGESLAVEAAQSEPRRTGHGASRPAPRRSRPAGDPCRLFPRPEVLADADLAHLGLTAARARTLRALAAAVARGDLALEPEADPEATRAALRRIAGIGPWTAEYVAMRVLRDPDAFPAGDLGLRRAWARLGNGALASHADAWRPWRAYAAMHLWNWEAHHADLDR
jgi:AraC family transcriptional regulator of adaptative response / DNA-3-methyladenine glycosylase II